MDGKLEQRVCIKLCIKLGKSASRTHEMLHEAFGEHFLSRTVDFEWHSCFWPVECQLKKTNIQGDQASAKQQKMLKKFKNSSTKTVAKNP
jgi:hypothetical protein